MLANLAAWPEGHRALLRSATPGLLEMAAALVAAPDWPPTAAASPAPAQLAAAQPELRHAALLLLRNLAFAPEAPTYMLANPAVLPGLLAAAEGVAEDTRGAAYAASGLWALVWQQEKVGGRWQCGRSGEAGWACSRRIRLCAGARLADTPAAPQAKAALRRLPSAAQRLAAAQATAHFMADRAGLSDAAAALAEAADEDEAPGPARWLQQACAALDGLVEALTGAAEAGRVGRAARSPLHGQVWGDTDRSPARDQLRY